MNGNILIPKKRVIAEVKDAGGSPFWDNFWQTFDDKEQYVSRTKKLNSDLDLVISKSTGEVPLYLEINLEEKASSKSSKPSKIFKESNIDVVSSDADNNIVITGRKSDIEKLGKIISQSNFETAKYQDGNRKEKNIYREVYSLQGVTNVTTGTKGRIGDDVKKLIEEKSKDIDCVIELRPDKRISDYDLYFQIINSQLNEGIITKRDTKLFLGRNMSFYGKLSSEEIITLLNNEKNYFIFKFLLKPVIVGERLVPSTPLDNIKIGSPLTNEVVGIFDSGVDNKLINGLIWNKENHLPSPFVSNNYHGTFVSGRILFGNDLFNDIKKGRLDPSCKILDVQILSEDRNGPKLPNNDPDLIMSTMLEIVKRYHKKVKIFNISIADENPINRNVISDWTEFLDILAREYDVLFIICTGNQHFYRISKNYDEIFENKSFGTYIASPSDSINSLTVGSLAQTCGKQSICKNENWPSPFTRIGGLRDYLLKPELVHFGGNIDKDGSGSFDGRQNGVEGLATDNYTKDSGTSFSTPIVTREAVFALDAIKKSNLSSIMNLDKNYSNLTKAMLIHSTFYGPKTKIKNERILLGYGLGIPDVKSLFNFDSNRATIVYCDKIKSNEKIQTLKFKLPEELSNKELQFNCTFVYNPQVDRNQIGEYQQTSLTATLRTMKMEQVEDDVEIVPNALNPSSGKHNFKSRKFNVSKFTRSTKIGMPYIEILIQMFNSQQLEQTQGEIEQSYALMVDIIDKESNTNLNELMLKTQQFEIMVEQQIQTSVEIAS